MITTTPLRFTFEELSLLQQALKIEALPGIQLDLLKGLNEEQKVEALKCADHTLRARNFIGWRNFTERVINPQLAVILRDYANPRDTIFVDTLAGPMRGLPFLYVLSKEAIYEQCQPEPGILQLRLLASPQELLQRLTPRSKRLPSPELEGLHGQIKQHLLIEALEVVRSDEEGARRCFAKMLPANLAIALAAAYHSSNVVQYMAHWKHTPTQKQAQPAAALTILQGQGQFYLLWVEQPELGEASLVTVRSATPRLLEDYVQKMLP